MNKVSKNATMSSTMVKQALIKSNAFRKSTNEFAECHTAYIHILYHEEDFLSIEHVEVVDIGIFGYTSTVIKE